MSRQKPLWTSSDWSWELLHKVYAECEKIAKKDLQLNWYPNQIEIISAEQMLDAYSSIGMPIYYQHWSFGKHFITEQKRYQSGQNGLAFEIVINSNPVINYLMEDNTMTTQALVIAHAAFGHNHFFKNNYLFKQWTDAGSIVDYLIFAKNYITEQEIKHGRLAVETWLDSCHALMDYGVNRYKRPGKISMAKEQQRQKERTEYLQSQVTELYRILPAKEEGKTTEKIFPEQPEENILYFFEKYSPDIKVWQREILRIVRKIAQYFYPQGQCVTGNHLIATPAGILRFDELVKTNGYTPVSNLNMMTIGNRFTPASHTYKKEADVIQLTTKTGKTFTGTPEHPIIIFRDGEEIMEKIENIKISDYIVTNLNYDIFSKTNPPLSFTVDNEQVTCKICGLKSNFIGSHISQVHNITPKEYTTNYSSFISNDISRINKSQNNLTKIPETMTPELGTLLAYISRINFSQDNSTFSFSDNRYELVEQFVKLLKNIFGINVQITNNKFKKPQVTFNSFTLKKFIIENFPDINKHSIPLKIRCSSKEVIRCYIRSIIDLYAIRRKSIGKFQIFGYDTHRDLFEQIQTILYGFGIVSRIYHDSERLTYAGICQQLGLSDYNSQSKHVRSLIFSIIIDHSSKYAYEIGSNITEFPNTDLVTNRYDIIPGAKELLDIVRNKLVIDRDNFAKNNNLSNRTLSYKTKINSHLLVKQNFISTTDLPYIRSKEITHEQIVKYHDKFENLVHCDYIPESKKLYELSQSCDGKFYDQVTTIEHKSTPEMVYDVTIPENHLFWLDGVISHNTKVMNEGFASLTHYEIMNRLHEKGLTTNGSHLEFLALHTNVLYQPDFNSRNYSGINPYAFGFAILRDIQRMCSEPTEEDKKWFPQIAGANARELILDAVANYRDESFIRQWLSPKIIRDWRLFAVNDDKSNTEEYTVADIHNDVGYEKIREKMADQYLRAASVPHIEVVEVTKKTKTLNLRYTSHRGRKLGNVEKLMPHLFRLWGEYPVILKDQDGSLLSFKQA